MTYTHSALSTRKFHLFINIFCSSPVWLFLVLFMLSVFCDKPPSTCGQTACPQYTRPVCATNGRVRRTFSNQCAVRTFNECSSDESEWLAINYKPIFSDFFWFAFRVQHYPERTLLKWLFYLKHAHSLSIRLLAASSSFFVCVQLISSLAPSRLFHQTFIPIKIKQNPFTWMYMNIIIEIVK